MEVYEDDKHLGFGRLSKEKSPRPTPVLISWFRRYVYMQRTEASYVWDKKELYTLISGRLEPTLSDLERSLWWPAFLL